MPSSSTDTACIEVTSTRTATGYGRTSIHIGGREYHVYAHRMVWTLEFGAIPPGLHVLHRCDNPPCVNPDHLFLGTNADNQHDKGQKGRATNYNMDKTHCKWGHEFTEENTRYEKRGGRACRTCARAR